MKKIIFFLVLYISQHYAHAANSDWVFSIAESYRNFSSTQAPTDNQRKKLRDSFQAFVETSVENQELQTLAKTLLFDHIDRFPHHDTTTPTDEVATARKKLSELATREEFYQDIKTLEQLIVIGQITYTARLQRSEKQDDSQ